MGLPRQGHVAEATACWNDRCVQQALTTVDCAPGAQGRTAEAIACYEQVALLHPDSADAHANLASSYKDAARQARAWQIA